MLQPKRKLPICILISVILSVSFLSLGSSADEVTGGGNIQEVHNASGQSVITMDIRDADIRDVLSSLALIMKKSIIYTEEPITISLKVEGVSAAKALELLVQSVDMTYISGGNTITVGRSGTIHENFYSMLQITRFELKYISPEEISKQVDKLAIPVQKTVLDSTKKYIWAQGTPQALAKMKELIYVLDREENIDPQVQEEIKALELKPIDLKYITANIMNALIQQLNIPCRTVLIDVNPDTLWVQADEAALTDIMNLKNSIDIVENYVPEEEKEEEVKIDTSIIEAKKLKNITASRLLPLVQGLDIPVKVFSIDSSGYNVWMRGDKESINLMDSLINQLDAALSRDDLNYFVCELTHLKAADAAAKLEFIGLEDTRVFLLNYPQYSRELLIACPNDRFTVVKNILKNLDVPSPKIKVVVDSSTSPSGQYRLEKRRDLIVALTGIPKESFKISDNVTRDTQPYYVLWVEETPENVKWIREVIESIDNPLGNLE